jgi:glycosyltransferase involved in cell wall biosynthesis
MNFFRHFGKPDNYASATHYYHEEIADLEVMGVFKFYKIHLAIWQLRQEGFSDLSLESATSRLSFLGWCVVHGRKEYRALQEFTQYWQELSLPANLPRTKWSAGISRMMQLIIAGRPDLDIDSRLLTADDQLKALTWFFVGGGLVDVGIAVQDIPAWQKKFLFNTEEIENSLFSQLVYLVRPDIQAAFDLNGKDSLLAYRTWIYEFGLVEAGLCGALKTRPSAWSEDIFKVRNGTLLAGGVNLIGYAYGELGIGEDVRMAARSLIEENIPFVILNVEPGKEISQNDRSLEAWVSEEPKYVVNIVCLTALEMLRVFLEKGRSIFQGRYNIGYWPWELSTWPENWLHTLCLVDEVWCSSQHTYWAINPVAVVPVKLMPMAVWVETNLPSMREARKQFKLPVDSIAFIFSFDGNSSVYRKNPSAVLKAFVAAFSDKNEKVNLVIKAMRTSQGTVWDEIKKASKEDKRITVIDTVLSKEEVVSLYNACNCFVSLHRAEGFGRGIAEALLLGMDVIATNYGGNRDFCVHEGSYLIPYEMTPVGSQEYVEPTRQRWADPSIEVASQAMQQIYIKRKDSIFRKHDVAKYEEIFGLKATAKKYHDRLAELGYV